MTTLPLTPEVVAANVRKAIDATLCRCGRGKPAGGNFCGVCCDLLPDELYKDLFLRFENGGIAAHLAAYHWLDEFNAPREVTP